MKKKTLVSTIALLFTVSGPAFAGGGLTGGATLPEQNKEEKRNKKIKKQSVR
jgi:hypothetical protein